MHGHPSQTTVQYVILHHIAPGGEHWDLMIEQPSALATWQLDANPADAPGQSIPARRIADHRKRYLNYQGPISGDRGTVTRVDRGTCIVLDATSRRWQVEFNGQTLVGGYELATVKPDQWLLRRTSVHEP